MSNEPDLFSDRIHIEQLEISARDTFAAFRWLNMRKGRFQKAAAKIAQRYGESVSFDRRLYRHDIAGSIAHAAALSKAGIISAAEQKKIETGLCEIEQEIESGKFQWDEALEDAHMNIERSLTKKIGAGGRRTTVLRSPDQ